MLAIGGKVRSRVCADVQWLLAGGAWQIHRQHRLTVDD